MDLLAHYYFAYAIGFLLMGCSLYVSELSQLTFFFVSARLFSFEIHQGLEMLKLASPRLGSLKNKSQTHFRFLWNPTKVINP